MQSLPLNQFFIFILTSTPPHSVLLPSFPGFTCLLSSLEPTVCCLSHVSAGVCSLPWASHSCPLPCPLSQPQNHPPNLAPNTSIPLKTCPSYWCSVPYPQLCLLSHCIFLLQLVTSCAKKVLNAPSLKILFLIKDTFSLPCWFLKLLPCLPHFLLSCQSSLNLFYTAFLHSLMPNITLNK